MRRGPAPEVQSGLSGPLERRLMRHYGRTPAARMQLAAALKALGVLVRRHPGAAVDMAASGLVQASRVGVREITERLRHHDREAPASPAGAAARAGRKPLSRKELRRFRRLLDREI